MLEKQLTASASAFHNLVNDSHLPTADELALAGCSGAGVLPPAAGALADRLLRARLPVHSVLRVQLSAIQHAERDSQRLGRQVRHKRPQAHGQHHFADIFCARGLLSLICTTRR